MPRYLASYWGKARPLDGAFPWHPLAYHSLDVAAVMGALLDLRPRWLTAIAAASGLSPAETRRRLVLAAALHDLGKFAENFQQKAPALQQELMPGAFAANDRRGHGEMGAVFWTELNDRRFSVLRRWMAASFAHHGAPVADSTGTRNAMSSDAQADAQAFIDAVVKLIGAPDERRVGNLAETWRVAGLMILADWIGSNQQWFPFEPPVHPLEAYWALARQRAEVAVTEARLAEAATAAHVDLGTLLGADAVASPLQAWAERQRPGSGPRLYLIEDLTGSGKTEAALILAHRLMQATAAEGLYWALPSMATANGLHARLEQIYRKLFATDGIVPSLVLAHSARDLNSGFQASIGREQIRSYGGEGAEAISGEAACAAFVADDRRKTFLAQVGIGTLDQALLAVLPSRHQSLRLAALSRRVLVVDEAHSYDPYMVAELERLLKFHHALGGSAIVLSATLTLAQRQRLAAIYGGSSAIAACSLAFPLATEVGAADLVETPLDAARGTRRDLPMRRFDRPEEVMAALVEAARGGACCAYVRNTVKDAVAAFDHLRTIAGADVTVELFHARFALGDRMEREGEALARFGRDGIPEVRRGRILVATQVVEQSLDLDFDYMATDLCPIDLMIQRAGRLHRHGHRPWRPPPELWVVGPEAVDDAGPDWYAGPFPHARFVYPDAGQLWRTMRILTDKRGLPLASGSARALIEPVFGGQVLDVPPAIDVISMNAEAERLAQRGVGHISVLDVRKFDRQAGRWDSGDKTPTRLGDETRTLRLARWADGSLQPWREAETEMRSWRLSEIAVRAKRVAETEAPDAAAAAAIVLAQQSWPGRFDPPPILALTPGASPGVWEGTWKDAQGRRQAVRYSRATGLETIG
ncbi:MAG: CRISPR-associated helicase Cas3' [Rhizobiales bacterium]|nr:CRISPR-associated helicase Cas3' [Hyphomicrobiales bacterium]